MSEPMIGRPRPASIDDLDTIVDILVGAFYEDPTWSWAFPDPDQRRRQHRELWSIFARGALRFPYTWLTPADTATALWIPPGAEELDAAQEDEVEAFIERELGGDAPRVLALLEQFDEAHPRGTDHFYLSFLGTRVEDRGHGYGLSLLGATLKSIDQQHQPAYLEASNEVNVELYGRFGFTTRDRFRPQADGPVVTTMWRDPQ